MAKWIWLDMDGTLCNFYGVDGWLDDLIAHNTRPYAEADTLYDDIDLLSLLVELKASGYKLGVISWSSKEHNQDFDKAVEATKKAWLAKHYIDVLLDKVIVTAYGICKAETCKAYGEGILVDDEKQNRDAWFLGETIDATKNIINELRRLV